MCAVQSSTTNSLTKSLLEKGPGINVINWLPQATDYLETEICSDQSLQQKVSSKLRKYFFSHIHRHINKPKIWFSFPRSLHQLSIDFDVIHPYLHVLHYQLNYSFQKLNMILKSFSLPFLPPAFLMQPPLGFSQMYTLYFFVGV